MTTVAGTSAGGVTVIDDYGHHPVEIRAVLATARQTSDGRVVAVVQPHRYSRLSALFEDFCTAFNDADCVLVAPVYAAGEAPLPAAAPSASLIFLRSGCSCSALMAAVCVEATCAAVWRLARLGSAAELCSGAAARGGGRQQRGGPPQSRSVGIGLRALA